MLPRLYPILDVESLDRRRFPVTQAAQAMLDAGVGILQWRSKKALSRVSLEQIEEIAEKCAGFGVPFVVNDRADAAMLVHAGLHVGQEDMAPSDARRLIGEDTLLGFSTHNEAQLRAGAIEPVNYVALGPMFATASKLNPDPVVGLEKLASWRNLVELPIVAIGGITRENALDVLEHGADSVAIIGDLLPEQLTQQSLRRRIEEWLSLIS